MQQNSQRMVSMKVDYAFTQIMKNPDVLKGFLSCILRLNVQDIEQITVEDRYLSRISEQDKLGILDVHIKEKNIGDVDIELQVEAFKNWAERSIFYTCKLYADQIQRGKSYDSCKKVIHISVLDFILFKEHEYFYSQYHLREDRDGRLYSDSLEFHVLELKKIKNTRINPEDQALYKWADFFNAERREDAMKWEDDEYIKRALEELDKLSMDKDRYQEYELRQKALLDYQSQLKSSWEEGEAQGILKGKTEGKIEGKIETLQLMKFLYDAKLYDEIPKAVQDQEYYQMLCKKYNISSQDE